ncbi:MAG: aspartyl/asparaginyl beta-hydroxylase domain-containing protein [Gammaproteobacteria bacterium]|nr:aspartyl/asparaginyl beta-hydroxylase domain-containing protein [Gammaproteobacteria bacterium]
MGSIVSHTAYPKLAHLVSNWEVIRDECAALDRTNILIVDPDGTGTEKQNPDLLKTVAAVGRAGWFDGWGPVKEKWLKFALVFEDERMPFWLELCPKTAHVLSAMRGIHLAGLSLFKPGGWLPPHSHPELAAGQFLSFHLGLEMENEFNYLNVDGEFVREEEGRGIVFDGSNLHYAFNFSERDRLILYIEFSPQRLRYVPA